MTDHITISRALLKQAMNALLLPCDRWNKQQFKIVTAAAEAIRAELAKPVEQVEPVAWIYGIPGHKNAASCERIPLDMCPRGTTEAPLYLHPPTPAWHDAPTEPGLWLCNDGDDNPYRRTTHRVTFPLNQLLVGEDERWFGPIPQDKEGGAV